MPLPGPFISTRCIPALGGDGKASTREQGLSLKGVFFYAATFFIAVKSPKSFLASRCVLCTSSQAWVCWSQGCVMAIVLVGHWHLEKCVLSAAVISPCPVTLAPVTLAPHTLVPAVYLVLVCGLGQHLVTVHTESPWAGMSYCTGCATGSSPTPLHALDHCCVSGANYLLLSGELSWKNV